MQCNILQPSKFCRRLLSLRDLLQSVWYSSCFCCTNSLYLFIHVPTRPWKDPALSSSKTIRSRMPLVSPFFLYWENLRYLHLWWNLRFVCIAALTLLSSPSFIPDPTFHYGKLRLQRLQYKFPRSKKTIIALGMRQFTDRLSHKKSTITKLFSVFCISLLN